MGDGVDGQVVPCIVARDSVGAGICKCSIWLGDWLVELPTVARRGEDPEVRARHTSVERSTARIGAMFMQFSFTWTYTWRAAMEEASKLQIRHPGWDQAEDGPIPKWEKAWVKCGWVGSY